MFILYFLRDTFVGSKCSLCLIKQLIQIILDLSSPRNGGGAFFIPYLIAIAVVALPLMFMDLCIGQFCSLDTIKCRDYSPIFRG